MRGIILAAGRGSRLHHLTDDRPKCLVRLAGRPLLAWQQAALAAAGVTELAIVAGYRADMLSETAPQVFIAPRWAESNMVRSLLAASSWLAAEPCVVSYSDIVYSAATVRRLIAAPEQLAIAYDPWWKELWTRRFADPRDDAETFRLTADGAVAAIGERPRTVEEIQGQYMGLLRFTPRAWATTLTVLDRLSPQRVDKLDMTGLLQALICTGERVQAVPCHEGWGEVDNADDLAICEDLVAKGRLRYGHEQEVHQ